MNRLFSSVTVRALGGTNRTSGMNRSAVWLRHSQRRLGSTTPNTNIAASTSTAAATTTATATATARASYRWLITGLAVPLTLGLLLDRSLAPTPSAPLGAGLFNSTSASDSTPQHRLLEEPEVASHQQENRETAPPGLHETTGPIIEQPLAGSVSAHILNEQAKMWTCLWGMTGEAPCSFPVI